MAADKLTLGELLKALAKKANIPTDEGQLKEILDNAEISGYEIQKELADAYSTKLLSIDAAKDNHPEIASVYKAQVLNRIDTDLASTIAALDFDDDTKTRLAGETNTYKRLQALTVEAVKKLKERKQDADTPADKLALQNKIDELQTSLRENKAELSKKDSDFLEVRKKDLVNFALTNKFTKLKTIYDKTEEKYRNTILNTAIGDRLEALNAEFVAENGTLKLIGKNGDKVFDENHTEISPDDLIQGTLAQKNMLVLTDTAAAAEADAESDPIPGKNRPPKGTNQYASSFNSKMLEDFNKSN